MSPKHRETGRLRDDTERVSSRERDEIGRVRVRDETEREKKVELRERSESETERSRERC
jgi:hypothetical protein